MQPSASTGKTAVGAPLLAAGVGLLAIGCVVILATGATHRATPGSAPSTQRTASAKAIPGGPPAPAPTPDSPGASILAGPGDNAGLRPGPGRDQAGADRADAARRLSSEWGQRFRERFASGDFRGALAVMKAWVETDPFSAAKYTRAMDPGPERDRLLAEVAQGWAVQNPAAAMNWAAQGNTTSERQMLVAAVCRAVGETNPKDAISLAESSGQIEDYVDLKGSLAERWTEQDPSAAIAWVLAQPSGKIRNQFVAEVASVQARSSPVEAAALVVQQITPGPEQDNAVLAVLDGWARQDLAAANAWVAGFPSNRPLLERAKAVLAASQSNQPP